MKRLISIITILLWASAAWGGMSAPRKLVSAGGSGCTGTFGNQNTSNSVFYHGANAALVLRKVTINCAGTNPYINARTYYALDDSDYQITLVIYNSSGNRVAYSGPFQDTAAADPWYAAQSKQVTASLTSGDYWVGVLTRSPLTYLSEGGTSGDYRVYEPGWNAGVPPATLGSTASSGTGTPIVWLSF